MELTLYAKALQSHLEFVQNVDVSSSWCSDFLSRKKLYVVNALETEIVRVDAALETGTAIVPAASPMWNDFSDLVVFAKQTDVMTIEHFRIAIQTNNTLAVECFIESSIALSPKKCTKALNMAVKNHSHAVLDFLGTRFPTMNSKDACLFAVKSGCCECVQILLKTYEFDSSLATFAIRQNNIPLVRLFISHNVKLNPTTIWKIQFSDEFEQIVEWLMQICPPSSPDRLLYFINGVVQQKNSWKIARLAAVQIDFFDVGVLTYAMHYGDVEVVRLLLANALKIAAVLHTHVLHVIINKITDRNDTFSTILRLLLEYPHWHADVEVCAFAHNTEALSVFLEKDQVGGHVKGLTYLIKMQQTDDDLLTRLRMICVKRTIIDVDAVIQTSTNAEQLLRAACAPFGYLPPWHWIVKTLLFSFPSSFLRR